MTTQRELHLPSPPANDIIRARIMDIERQIIAAESTRNHAELLRLHGERKRLKAILAK